MEIFNLSSQELESLLMHTNTSLLSVMKDVRQAYKTIIEQHKQATNFSVQVHGFAQCKDLSLQPLDCRQKTGRLNESESEFELKANAKQKEVGSSLTFSCWST